jgi:hypothetical protein
MNSDFQTCRNGVVAKMRQWSLFNKRFFDLTGFPIAGSFFGGSPVYAMPPQMRNAVVEICKRFGVSQALLARKLEVSPSLLSQYASGKVSTPKRILWALGFGQISDELLAEPTLTPRQFTSTDLDSVPPLCPECGAQPRLRPDYRKHWFHGNLNNYAYCNGTQDRPHDKVKLGVLAGGSAWIRIDRVMSKAATHINQEVPILRRRSKTAYERRHGWVWCPVCGWMCRPSGNYAFHARHSSSGPTYSIFRCTNPECPQPGRLKCIGGRILRGLPHRGRTTTLPVGARKCPHCGGKTIRNGALRDLIQLRCKECRKVLHFNPALSRGRFVSLRVGGPLSRDAHRPRCAKGDTMILWRLRLGAYRNLKRRVAVPLPVRRGVNASTKTTSSPKDVVVIRYSCSHKTVWKLPDGTLLHTHYKGRNRRRGVREAVRAPT